MQWVESHLLRSLGLNNSGEIASVDLKPAVSSEKSLDESRLAKSSANVSEGPRAPVPSLLTEQESSQHDGFDHPSTVGTRPKPNSVDSDVPGSEIGPAVPSSMKRPIALAKALEQQAPPADPSVKQASAAFHPVSPGDPERPDPKVKADLLDTLAALLPANAESSALTLPTSPAPSLSAPSTQKSFADGGDSWAVLERKMQSLGVSRYVIEGQPGDRVVFSCLIPLAGRQAITQRFEAEGDDVVQAAQATLRRITLWRATQ